MRFKGFKNPPVDHYGRPYHLAVEPKYKKFPNFCTGSEPRHVGFFNYYRDVFRMYGHKRKIMFGFHSELSHQDNNLMKNVRGLEVCVSGFFGFFLPWGVVREGKGL